jgi:uncharacterized protein
MLFRSLLVVLFLAPSAWAQSLPGPLTDTVSDFAEVLPPEEETRLAAELSRIRAETGVHMVVVTMDRIERYGGAGLRIESYAKNLFNSWGIGDPARNDGILFLVSVDDKVTRIALGSGYDAVYDGRATRVIDTAVLPEFREGRIPEGIAAGVQSARDRLIAPFLEGKPVSLTEGFPEPASSAPLWAGGLAAGAALLIFGGRSIWRSRKRCPKCGQLTLTRHNEVLTAASRYSSGNGIRHMNCQSCGFTDREHYLIPAVSDRDDDNDNSSGGRSGGGSSGGFGGGSSSGGGGTGRW